MKRSFDISTKIAVLVTFACLYSSVFSAQLQMVGGYSSVSAKDKEVIAAAKFAIKEKSKSNELKLLEVEEAERQVVAGMNYKMWLKVESEGKTKSAEVVVWKKLSKEYALTSWAWR